MTNLIGQNFDLVVIGAGPAGYTAAIKAAQLGMKVACVEKRSTLGGTCLNVGCIPSKTLLHLSHTYEHATKNFVKLGIKGALELDLATMMERKNKVVADLCKGIEGLFSKNQIQSFLGNAKIIDSNTVAVGENSIKASNILIATGSEVANLENVVIDEQKILSSTGALALDFIPKTMLIIGAGYIGLELGSVWRRLGAKVSFIEYGDGLLTNMDFDLAKELHKILQKQGLEFQFATKVESAMVSQNGVTITTKKIESGNLEQIHADIALVSVGRKSFTNGLGLQEMGITQDAQNRIIVDQHFRTNKSNIYAVGDVIAGPMLAHKAEEEAIAAVEIMAGQSGHVNYNTIPSVIYTDPEVASVGASEQQLKQQGINYKIGKFPFLANSRARSTFQTDGFVKILADAKTDRILGAHIIGANASVMISQITLGMEFAASCEDLARTCYPHPTLSEAIKEAAMSVENKAINI